jgi:osmotically-inducible protein OsmY
MKKHGCFLLWICLCLFLTSACLGPGSLLSGAKLIYDRHGVYEKIDNYQLAAQVNKALFKDKILRKEKCVLDIAVFNGDVLVAGQAPTPELKESIHQRLSTVHGYRELFIQIVIKKENEGSLKDGWITTKIRSQILADSTINPNIFKIVTVGGIVYIMGDVPKDQAFKVINIARQTQGVIRVVKMLRYYTIIKE